MTCHQVVSVTGIVVVNLWIYTSHRREPVVEFIALAASYVAPAPVVECIAPAASSVTSAPVDEYIAPAPAVDVAPAHVVKYISSAPVGYAAPAPVDEYISPVPAVDTAPAPVVEHIAPVHAVSCSEPVPVVCPLSPDASDMSAPEDMYTSSWDSLPMPIKIKKPETSAEAVGRACETPTVMHG